MQKTHDSSYNDYWKNKPNITTPIVQDQLNRIETTIDTIDDRVVTFDTTKANQTDLLADIKNVSFDSSTGTFTFTKQNNTTIIIDTDIEKIAINFDYDDDPESAHYQSLIITLDDGTVKYIDMSALITEYEFTDSSVIHFTITNGVISADVINGSITAEKLQPNFLADCVSAKEGAETAETNAETAETNALAHQYTAEAWAKGTKNNVPVTPADAQYHDNAYYWAQQARSIVGDKVDSFNGRTGTVVAEDGDYESGMIVPEAGAISGQVPVVRNVGTGQDVKLRYVNEDLDIGLKPHIIVISETGSTVTLTKGTKIIYADETSPEHFEADVTEFGTWVIDSVLGGDDAQVSLVVDAVKIYTVDDSHWHADITVTYPTGGTCSCSKSGTTTLYATGSPYTFTVHESGTYTITATANGETYTDTVEVTTSGQTENLTIPEGSTVTPTDSVATLLSCAGIHDTSITTISELLADTTTLLAVINSNNAIDYLVRSTTFIMGDKLVPVMTSNTTPSGVVSAQSTATVGNEFHIFDDDDSTYWAANNSGTGSTAQTAWVQYEFPNDTIVKGFYVKANLSGNNYTIQSYSLYGSDGATLTLLDSGSPAVSIINGYSKIITNNTAYKYYRLSVTMNIPGMSSTTRLPLLTKAQFYSGGLVSDSTAMSYIGLNNYAANTLLADSDWLNAICNSTYFESVLNVKVPTMTSNTTPSGTCFASSQNTNNPPYKAFDGTTTQVWLSANGTRSATIGYDFETSKKIVCFKIYPYGSGYSPKNCTVQCSEDNSTWTTVDSLTCPETQEWFIVPLSTINNARYWRLNVADTHSQAYIAIREIQFCGREDV